MTPAFSLMFSSHAKVLLISLFILFVAQFPFILQHTFVRSSHCLHNFIVYVVDNACEERERQKAVDNRKQPLKREARSL